MSSKKDAKVLVLLDGTNLIAEVEEAPSELGEPDCRLIEPHIIQEYKNGSPTAKFTFKPWLLNITFQSEIMISSDKILTIVDPTTKLIAAYEELFK
jgi:hypothetical protein